MPQWIEVDFHLPGELAEPVAALLRSLTSGGVAIEHDGEAPDLAQSPVRLRGWLPDDESLPARLQRLEHGLWHLGQIHPIPSPEYRPVPDAAWSDAWRDLHHPLPVGEQLVVLPPWCLPPPGSRIPLTIEPGMAFGTGTHPTTRHCLQALEDLLQPGTLVADLGCGSGILGIAAAKLGARLALAYDTDPLAVQAAAENAARNGVREQVQVALGSLPELRGHAALRDRPPGLLLANIHAAALEQLLAQGLAEAVEPGGKAVLSGILEEQADQLARQAAAGGLRLLHTMAGGDWRTLILERKLPLQQGQS